MNKYRNTYILTILGQKYDFFTALPCYELQKIIILFYFSNRSLHNVLPKGDFWWFARIYWGQILIKYQNTCILMIMAPKCDFLPRYPAHELQKSLFFFIFPITSYVLCSLNVIFWWFGRIYWGEILIKYQNTYILTIFYK